MALQRSVNIFYFKSRDFDGVPAYFCSSVYAFIRVITGLFEHVVTFEKVLKFSEVGRFLIKRYFSRPSLIISSRIGHH